jgi:hypothetical protein
LRFEQYSYAAGSLIVTLFRDFNFSALKCSSLFCY